MTHEEYEELLGPVTPAPTYCNASTDGSYDGRELRDFTNRPEAMAAYRLPSLMNGRLVFPKQHESKE